MAIDLEQPPVDDGLEIRDSNPWALDKLAIVECYVSAFSSACSKKAPSWQVVDAFAGPGVNRVKTTGELVWGTPMLCLAAKPEIPQLLAMDLGETEVASLRERTAEFAPRIAVERGDVNSDLLIRMRDHLSPRAPTLCILDPEGTELDFATIERLAEFRQGRTKAELLVLLATHTGFLRTLTREGDGFPWAPERMDRLYGTHRWRDIWEQRKAGKTSEWATEQYVKLYAEQLRQLGYTHVLDRQIRERGREGRLGYYLLFASEHNAGQRIMEHCFDTRYSDDQLSLFTVPRVSHLKP